MCRNIRPLFNFDPPATDAEIRDASLQFVRKISGFRQPSKANERSFLAAVDEVAHVSTNLLRSLETNAQPRTREQEIAKAKARSAARFPARVDLADPQHSPEMSRTARRKGSL
ncbi:DUF2277 domain-containing protein [Candidatus Bathyarchaeota archaeon]|nr:MAG: DUF2277 domain-containing protein [Candidatus Bathyarchaeota archaeon]TMI52947.1 MAG: DUF2277 domain-containing protein [Candidatus Bathyarchaeota archaeon]